MLAESNCDPEVWNVESKGETFRYDNQAPSHSNAIFTTLPTVLSENSPRIKNTSGTLHRFEIIRVFHHTASAKKSEFAVRVL